MRQGMKADNKKTASGRLDSPNRFGIKADNKKTASGRLDKVHPPGQKEPVQNPFPEER
jgi:hypothetical protein